MDIYDALTGIGLIILTLALYWGLGLAVALGFVGLVLVFAGFWGALIKAGRNRKAE